MLVLRHQIGGGVGGWGGGVRRGGQGVGMGGGGGGKQQELCS